MSSSSQLGPFYKLKKLTQLRDSGDVGVRFICYRDKANDFFLPNSLLDTEIEDAEDLGRTPLDCWLCLEDAGDDPYFIKALEFGIFFITPSCYLASELLQKLPLSGVTFKNNELSGVAKNILRLLNPVKLRAYRKVKIIGELDRLQTEKVINAYGSMLLKRKNYFKRRKGILS